MISCKKSAGTKGTAHRFNGYLSLAVAILALMGVTLLEGISAVQAQDRGFHPHEFRDTRYNHNHYYPIRGGYVTILPRGHRVVLYDGGRYFFFGGIWYRPYGSHFLIIAPPVGIVIPALPPYYETVRLAGVPYYYANEVYYVQAPGGYMVVNPPPTAPASPSASIPSPSPPSSASSTLPSAERIFIYPRQGQTEKQQADDRYACHRWAVEQTGFDPTQSSGAMPEAQKTARQADYQRAQTACLEGRGYTVK